MAEEKEKVYLYTRVSTAMQIDGYSLDARKSRMKAFCEFNEYEIDGTNERFYKTMRSQPNLTKNSKICKLRLVDRWSLLFYD